MARLENFIKSCKICKGAGLAWREGNEYNTRDSLLLTGLLASPVVGLMRLSGFGSEEAMFLQAAGASINLRGLLLVGMLDYRHRQPAWPELAQLTT